MEKEVQCIINTLGFLERGKYYPEPDCFQNVRDLIRYMHRDDQQFTVRRICTTSNIVKNDLVPIMKMENVTDELFDASLRLTVNLCQPTITIFSSMKHWPPEDDEEWKTFYELEGALVGILLAFLEPKIFEIFCSKIHDYFDKEWEDRTEKQRILVERIFMLLRYIFAIGVESGGQKLSKSPFAVDHHARGRVIANFFRSGITDIFLKLSSNSTEREFGYYVVAIVALIFKTMDPRAIACEEEKSIHHRNETNTGDKEKAAQIADLLRTKEENMRRTANHSFLKGTYVVRGLKPLNQEKEFVLRRSVNMENENTPIEVLSQRKKRKVVPRNRRVAANLTPDECGATSVVCIEEDGGDGSSIDGGLDSNAEAGKLVKQFCYRMLLEGHYNKLMRLTRDMAISGGSAGRQKFPLLTDLNFFTLATFMMAFARHSHYSSKHINATFSVEFFHQLTSYLLGRFELMKVDKPAARKYALSAQFAMSTLRELMVMLNTISNSIIPEDKEIFAHFCEQLFKVQDNRELFSELLTGLFPAGTTNRMLRDLLLSTHYFLHVLEKCVRQGLLKKVQKKKKKQKRRKKKAGKGNKEDCSGHKREKLKSMENAVRLNQLGTIWQEIVPDLSDSLMGELPMNEDVSPVDMLLNADDELLQEFARLQVQVALRTGQVANAVGIYRSARIFWPEQMEKFGTDEMGAEDELLQMHDIFHADMQSTSAIYAETFQKAYGKTVTLASDDQVTQDDEFTSKYMDTGKDLGSDEEGDYDEMAEESETELVESDFDFVDFITTSLVKPAIINWYIFCLREFRTNDQELNLAILKFFHRIAFELKLPAILYQVALFKILRDINRELSAETNAQNRPQHRHFALAQFGEHLLAKYFAHFKARGGGVMAAELLFSKSVKEARAIQHGYSADD